MASDDKVLFSSFVVLIEIVPLMNALPVLVPSPSHKLYTALCRMPCQHCIAEVSKNAIVTGQAICLELRSTFQNSHVFCSHFCYIAHTFQCTLHPNSTDVFLSVQYVACSCNHAKIIAVPVHRKTTVLDLSNLKAISLHIDCSFFKIPELRFIILFIHFCSSLDKK